MHKFFDKKIGSDVNVYKLLAQELHKPVIEKFQKTKLYARYKNNIWAADLVKIGSLSSKY